MDISLNHDKMTLSDSTSEPESLKSGDKLASITVQRCTHMTLDRTAYQWLKHFVYGHYGCMKWSEVDISLNQYVKTSFSLQSEPDFPNLGPLWPV